MFINDMLHAKIELVNDSGGDVSVTDLESSCGCIAILRPKKPIEKAGELRLDIRPQEQGETDVNAAFTFGGRVFTVTFRGTVLPRIAPINQTIEVKDGECTFEAKILDPSVNVKNLTWVCVPPSFKVTSTGETNGIIRGDLTAPSVTPEFLSIIPYSGRQPLHPISFALTYPGVTRVIPPRLYVSTKQESVRLLVVGDVSQLGDKLFADDVEIEADITKSSPAIIDFENPYSETGRRTVRFRCGEFRFFLEVNVR
ncbi:MAG: hypothetical protein WBD31_04180 [Rubripirellula sp.]